MVGSLIRHSWNMSNPDSFRGQVSSIKAVCVREWGFFHVFGFLVFSLGLVVFGELWALRYQIFYESMQFKQN